MGCDAHADHVLEPIRVRLMPSPALVKNVVNGLTATLHVHRFGIDHVRQAMRQSPTGTVLFCHWHQSLLALAATHQGTKAAALASRSKDGEIIARYLEAMGMRAVRGSSSRGAVAGAAELMRVLHDGYHIVLTVDGPRGPFKQVKDGAIEIARRHGVPLIPAAARASREFCFKRAWDQFRVPVPGSHLVVEYGAPIWITGPSGDPQERSRNRRVLACALHDLEAGATRRVARRDLYPHPRFLAWLGKPAETSAPESDS
jgi:lysophospholipid acyltransferase (LPLAT)-like uncharacterized protein